MTTELPIPVTGGEALKRLVRDVENLKRHTHIDPEDTADELDNIPPTTVDSVVDSTDWLADGASLTLTWTGPAYDTAGAEIDDLAGFDIQWQYADNPGWHSVAADAETDTVTIRGLTGSEAVDWRVRAYDTSGNYGDWWNGTTVTAADPNPPGGGFTPDTLSPKPPTGLGASSAIVDGTPPKADYVLYWTAPTQNTDDTALTDLMDYEVQWQYTGGGTWSATTTAEDSIALTGLDVGIDIDWRIRARDTTGNVSTWASSTASGASDTGAPNAPSAPILTTKLGTVTARWDGLDSVGGAMPSDFAHVRVYASDTPGFTASSATEVDRLYGAGSIVTTGFDPGETVYVKFTAVDTSGNVSAASAESSIVVDGVPPPTIDTLAPKPPTGLLHSSTVVPGPVPTLDVLLGWTPPNQNTDGTPLTDLADYEVQWKTPTGDWTTMRVVDSEAGLTGIPTGVAIDWQVRARDTSANNSTWATATISAASDTTPPDEPSNPGGNSSLGVIRVTWDGLDVDTDPMPEDFDHLEVYMGTSAGFTPSSANLIDTLSGPGTVIVTDVPLGQTRYFKTRAYDTSGNASPVSGSVAVTVTGITGDDIEADSITGNNIAGGTITGDLIQGNTITGDKIVAGTITGDKIGADEITGDKIAAGTITADDIASGTITGDLIQGGTITGDKIGAGEITANEIASGTITSNEIAANTITGDDIAGNTITANNIAAGAITAEKIALGVLATNLVGDPSFEQDYDIDVDYGDVVTENTKWRLYPGWSTAGWALTREAYPRSGQKGLYVDVDSTGAVSFLSPTMDVEPGETYVLSFTAAKLDAVNSARFYCRIVGGSDDTLSEYPATSQANSIQFDAESPTTVMENVDLPYAGSPINLADVDGNALQFVVPAGVTRAAIRFIVRGVSNAVDIIMDDVALVKWGQGATEITSAGIRLFGSEGVEVGAFVSNRKNYFSVTDGTGATLATISDEGDISGQTVYSVNDAEVMGQPLIGSFGDFQGIPDKPETLAGWFDMLPRGIVGAGTWSYPSNYDFTSHRGVYEVAFLAERGRAYEVTLDAGLFAALSGGSANYAGYDLRFVNPSTLDGEAATPDFTNSSIIGRAYLSAGASYGTASCTAYLRCDADDGIIGSGQRELNPGVVKLFITARGDNATVRYSSVAPIRVAVKDVGPAFVYNQRNNYTESGSGATTTPTTKTFTKTWSTSDCRTYDGDGGASYGQDAMYHGYSSYRGDSASCFHFNSSSIMDALSTAGGRIVNIKKVEVYLYANHWWYNSGGTAYLRYYNASSLPSSRPSPTYGTTTSANWPKPGGRWVNVDKSQWGAAFQSGAADGVMIGYVGSSNLLYYGAFNKTAKLRITYSVTE